MNNNDYLKKFRFVLFWEAKPVGRVLIGSGSYSFLGTEKIYSIDFIDSAPLEIKEKAEDIFIKKTKPDSLEFTIYYTEDFDRVLLNRIFEPHDEYVSLASFPEKVYARIEDPLLKKLVREKIVEWCKDFPYPDRKFDFEKLLAKINKIDNITKS